MSLDSPKNIPEYLHSPYFPNNIREIVLTLLARFVETDLEECLKSRTEQLSQFRDLGPPDLVQYRRVNGNKEVGAYHFVAGVDSSSSAALAAYLQDLRYMLPRQWTFQSGTYCCFNAFSRVDMRVEVKIPGGVKTHVIDERGNKQEATEALWLETYMSGIIRSLLYADDESYRITGYRRLNPIPNKEAERRFLDAAERLFPSGWQLGSDPEIQVANIATNHLTTAIMKYFCITGRWEQGINLFHKLREREPEVDLLLSKLYLEMDEEVKAADLMCSSLVENPLNYGFLVTQAKYLLKKNRPDLAVELAKAAVNANPSEYATWAILTESYIALDDFENALLTLNSCPMFTFHEKDNHKIPNPAKMHLPIPTEVTQSQIFDLPDVRSTEVDAKLLKLPAPGLHGTFAKAYALLTKINLKIGWDNLLKTRSSVFVMEEEYRIERGKPVESPPATNGITDDSEKRSVSSLDPSPPTPPEAPSEIGLPPNSAEHTAKEERSMFQSKRLCERWLDNLFMVLYDDLRVYTLWRAEWEYVIKQQSQFHKPNNEWEMLGELALRLHHKEEAEEAFRACLDTGFSAKAWRHLLPIYESRHQTSQVVVCIAKLTAWNLRWYSEFSPDLIRSLREVVEVEGFTKVKSLLMAPAGNVVDMMKGMINMSEAFEMKGHDM